jgi:O-succinylbenzoate synthase
MTPFRTATGTVDTRHIILVEMCDRDGIAAWSECVADAVPQYTSETLESAWHVLADVIMPLVLGKEFPHPTDVHSALWSWVPDSPMARAAIEMGTWALAAERRTESLARFLGRNSERGAPPRKAVATGIALGMESSVEKQIDRVHEAVSAGYRRIKLKATPQSDLEMLRRVCVDVAGKADMSVDLNGSCSLDRDKDFLCELDKLNLSMIEQPLAADELEKHAELQSQLSTSVCLDESIISDATAERMIRLGSARIVNMKPGRVGGFTEALAIHDRCRLASIPMWCGGMLESGIGRAYNVALASLPNFTLPGDLSPSSRYWNEDVTTIPWEMSADGMVTVPLDRPGIGVDVDMDFVDGITLRQEKFSA